jgi:hypothetical protein
VGGGGVDMPVDLMLLFRPGPEANLSETLDNAQQVLEVLVKADQMQAVEVRVSDWGLGSCVLHSVRQIERGWDARGRGGLTCSCSMYAVAAWGFRLHMCGGSLRGHTQAPYFIALYPSLKCTCLMCLGMSHVTIVSCNTASCCVPPAGYFGQSGT